MVETGSSEHRSDAPDELVWLPLTPPQARWCRLDTLYGTARCQLTAQLRFRGRLDYQALRAAFGRLVARHSILRTRIATAGGAARQYLGDTDGEGVFKEEEVAGRWGAEQLCRREREDPLKLNGGSLVRAKLLRLPDREYTLILILHPVICDRPSLRLLLRELLSLYRAAIVGGEDIELPQTREHDQHYVLAEHLRLGNQMTAEERAHWRRIFSSCQEPLGRRTATRSQMQGGAERRQVVIQLEQELVRKLSETHDVSPHAVYLSAWAAMFLKWLERSDVVVGVEDGGRLEYRDTPVIGPVRTLVPLYLKTTGDVTVEGLVQELACGVNHCEERGARGAWEDAIERNFSNQWCRPVMPLALSLNNTTTLNELRAIEVPGLEIDEISTDFAWPCAALSIAIDDLGSVPAVVVSYSTGVADGDAVEDAIGCWRSLLQDTSFVRGEVRKMISAPSNPGVDCVGNNHGLEGKLIHQLFEEEVRRHPDATAVTCDGESLTYAALNARANQLAWYLRGAGVGPDHRVGICLERSLDIVVGLLGILKAGGAYVPLDPDFPDERLSYMLQDATPSAVVSHARIRERLLGPSRRVIALDDDRGGIAKCPTGDLCAQTIGLRSDHLAYVIYTSGSTGRPKGVMVEHAAVVNLLHSMQREPGISAADRLLAVTTVAFDIAGLEIYLPLVSGAMIVLTGGRASTNVHSLMELLEAHDISIMQATPATWRMLLHGGWAGRDGLKVLCGGEELTSDLAAAIAERVACVWNMYGPTETTVWSSVYKVGSAGGYRKTEPIGGPIENTRIYVLDKDLQPLPTGVEGEIFIAGAGVARGYLNRPELTTERFLRDPFSSDPNTRMYKTGDLGKWRDDGILDYLGRYDDQVKIRGFRIELGEIEAHLIRHESVKEAVVIAREDIAGDKRLAAYVTLRIGASVRGMDLRSHLKEFVPEYMMPSAFVVMDQLPLTTNGKLDRRALPPPESGSSVSADYQAPQSAVEKRVAAVWEELLRVKAVGMTEDFFELGGNSLLAVQLLERLRSFGLSAEPMNIYAHPTLTEFARAIRECTDVPPGLPQNGIPENCGRITPNMLTLVKLGPGDIDRIVNDVPGGVRNVQDIYPLAPMQEGMLFHHLFNGEGGDTYVVPILLSLSSRDTVEKFIAALQHVIDRHDILRTAIVWDGLPQPVQVVYRKATLAVEQSTLGRAEGPIEQLRQRLQPGMQRLRLDRAPLMRLQIAADPDGSRWYAVLQIHHLIGDQESETLLLSEVSAIIDGNAQDLYEPAPYRDHVARSLKDASSGQILEYFREKLEGVGEPTAAFGLTDVCGNGCDLVEARLDLTERLAQGVRSQARRLKVGAAALFHVAWTLVLSCVCGRNDVVFGTLVLGRAYGAGHERRAMGSFINTLPVRVKVDGMSVRAVVEQVHLLLGELLQRERASLAIAQRRTGVGGVLPLFNTLLNYRYASVSEDREAWKKSGFELLARREWTNYPVVLSVDDTTDGFSLNLQSDRRVDPRRMLGYMLTALDSLVAALERDPGAPALSLRVLPKEERWEVVEGFNPNQKCPHESLIHELFEAQAQLHPEAIAVRFEGQSLTYAELNARANQVAWYLRELGIGRNQLVGLYFERGLEMVVGLLGILKAGGGYLPLDPVYPPERLAYMLADAGPPVVLTQERLKVRLMAIASRVIALDSDWKAIAESPTGNPAPRALGLTSDDLAYVIYTSGSTGKPKGVMVEHRNVVRLFAATEKWFGFDERDVWTLFHSVAFDFSVWELWGALLYGGRVVIVPQTTARSPREFYRLVCAEGVTVLNQTPSAFAQFIDAQGQGPDRKHSLRVVIFGGEALEFRTLRPWVERNGADLPALVNMYGITETTVHVTYRRLSRGEIESERGSIVGRPIPDLQVYLLDQQRQPTPIGVSGEIYVGGAGVARGYLRRPELTAERFLPDPFSAEPNARMYRTGDLGKWWPDGTIEYLGRNDDQVKLRGFRIELGEIETQLAGHPQVREAVVVVHEDASAEKRLVAYVGPKCPSEPPRAELLREYLLKILPDYMVPSAFVAVDSFPLTANGKLDRRALPAPDVSSYATHAYEPPQGDTEQILAEIWRKLLQIDRIGRHDRFFDLGGNSLVATRVMVHVSHRFGIEIPMRVIFEKHTLIDMARFISDEISTEGLLEAL